MSSSPSNQSFRQNFSPPLQSASWEYFFNLFTGSFGRKGSFVFTKGYILYMSPQDLQARCSGHLHNHSIVDPSSSLQKIDIIKHAPASEFGFGLSTRRMLIMKGFQQGEGYLKSFNIVTRRMPMMMVVKDEDAQWLMQTNMNTYH